MRIVWQAGGQPSSPANLYLFEKAGPDELRRGQVGPLIRECMVWEE
jgi:hypothetical protein